MYVEKDNNIIKIITFKDYTIAEYLDELAKNFDKKEYHKISLSTILFNYKIDDKIKAQIIYILQDKSTIYNISKESISKDIKILEKKYENDIYYKTLIYKDKKTLEYKVKISKYNIKTEENEEQIVTDKNLVLKYIKEIFQKTENDNNLNMRSICQNIIEYFHLIKDEYYNDLINDGVIGLSTTRKDIFNSKFEFLDIVKLDTKQKIGDISFNYHDSNFTYHGNVSYEIYDEFRNNHYATRALKLLKKLLKNHQFDGDKDLYIATKVDNIYSGKVALNNGAKLIYKGKVPKNESIYYIEGIKKVKVYKIKM